MALATRDGRCVPMASADAIAPGGVVDPWRAAPAVRALAFGVTGWRVDRHGRPLFDCAGRPMIRAVLRAIGDGEEAFGWSVCSFCGRTDHVLIMKPRAGVLQIACPAPVLNRGVAVELISEIDALTLFSEGDR